MLSVTINGSKGMSPPPTEAAVSLAAVGATLQGARFAGPRWRALAGLGFRVARSAA
jgi:hypothetical protein